jgi:hypothetical protein
MKLSNRPRATRREQVEDLAEFIKNGLLAGVLTVGPPYEECGCGGPDFHYEHQTGLQLDRAPEDAEKLISQWEAQGHVGRQAIHDRIADFAASVYKRIDGN